MHERARALGERIRAEDVVGEAARAIEALLGARRTGAVDAAGRGR